MLVFGTQIHIVTFIFIVMEFGMFIFQFFYFQFRPQDKSRLWYLILLALLLFYNVTGGLFPDHKITSIPIPTQLMIAYGSGFLMASYFPFYFYKAFDLKVLRWHALYGVPLFLMAPYLLFFVIAYAINGNLNVDIKLGVVVPFIYSLVLLWVILKAIRNHYNEEENHKNAIEEIAVYCAVSPWAAMTVFSWFQVSQLVEVLCTNFGFIIITVIFILKAIKNTRQEYEAFIAIKTNRNVQEGFSAENFLTYGLTKREIEIVSFIHRGLKNKVIADSLNISEGTVKKHIENIFNKTGVTSRGELLHKLYFK